MNTDNLELPPLLDVIFFKKLAIYFGKDQKSHTCCFNWRHFIEQYPHLRPKIEKYLEKATTGDPAYEMYCMVQCGSSREWAEEEIPKVRIGDPIWVISSMVIFCGSSKEWAEKAKEENKKWRELSQNYPMR